MNAFADWFQYNNPVTFALQARRLMVLPLDLALKMAVVADPVVIVPD